MVPVTDTDNRRHARRFRAHHPAQILLGSDAMIPCTVKDISTGGARLALKPHMDLPETFDIFIAAHDLQVRRARVCWRNGDLAGIAFS
ncbi:MAG: PilZ domain-containing protein, partial [Microvirga sp.]